MTDGSALLMSLFFAFDHSDFWSASRGSNLLDGGAHTPHMSVQMENILQLDVLKKVL